MCSYVKHISSFNIFSTFAAFFELVASTSWSWSVDNIKMTERENSRYHRFNRWYCEFTMCNVDIFLLIPILFQPNTHLRTLYAENRSLSQRAARHQITQTFYLLKKYIINQLNRQCRLKWVSKCRLIICIWTVKILTGIKFKNIYNYLVTLIHSFPNFSFNVISLIAWV